MRMKGILLVPQTGTNIKRMYVREIGAFIATISNVFGMDSHAHLEHYLVASIGTAPDLLSRSPLVTRHESTR